MSTFTLAAVVVSAVVLSSAFVVVSATDCVVSAVSFFEPHALNNNALPIVNPKTVIKNLFFISNSS